VILINLNQVAHTTSFSEKQFFRLQAEMILETVPFDTPSLSASAC